MNILDKYEIYQNKKAYDNKKAYPFHNDKYMIEFILSFINNIEYFIETGSYYGKTSYFMAKNFKNIKCYSCEINENYYKIALEKLKDLENLTYELKPSPYFLYDLNQPEIFQKKNIFLVRCSLGK